MKTLKLIALAAAAITVGTGLKGFIPVHNEVSVSSSVVDPEVQAKCQEALDKIDINVDASNVLSSFHLPYRGLYACIFTWTSSDPTVIKIDDTTYNADVIAYVTRPAADTDVKLTVNAVIDDNTASKVTKEFTFKVIKAAGTSSQELPLAFEEDFSNFYTGLDISNYAKWAMAAGESTVTEVVDELPNFNNMVSSKALAIDSKRTAADIYYEAQANVKKTDAPNGAIFEGYMMFTGETNGVSLELVSSAGVVTGFQISSSAFSYMASKAYAPVTSIAPKEGVWEKFRIVFRMSGYAAFYVYDWENGKYVDCLEGAKNVLAGAGIFSGQAGDISKVRIRVNKGSKTGVTYLSNLKIDTLTNLPETAPTNPNRKFGLGEISNFQPVILGYKGEAVSGVDPEFVVKNRFASSETFIKGTDYSVTYVKNSNEDGSVDVYTYTFKLIKNNINEEKTVTQTVYYDDKTNVASITGFKASYLKANSTDKTKGSITLTGNVIRADSTFYYMVLSAGSAAPTIDQVESGQAITGLVDKGNVAVANRELSITTSLLDIAKEYDVYGVTKNTSGSSVLYSSLSISTVVNISTPAELHEMATSIDLIDSYCRLINDIDMSSYYWVTDTSGLKFAGTLDGQGHTIKGLRISGSSGKEGLFYYLYGTVKNLTFDSAYISGLTDVGVIAGDIYQATVSDVTFKNCKVDIESTVAGGDGYLGIMTGRFRKNTTSVTDISIQDGTIKSNQRSGLLAGGVDGATVNVTNIFASGSIEEEGAQAGLIGRNSAGQITIENACVFLDVINSKKEVGLALGRNETNSNISVSDFIGDLKIEALTQTTYFNNLIGYYAGTPADYTCSNTYFISEDYSALSDSITNIGNSVNSGKTLSMPDEAEASWWETKTFIKDFDTSTTWGYDEINHRPCLRIRKASDISFTASQVETVIEKVSLTDVVGTHYYILKAYDMLDHLASGQTVSSDKLAKLASAKNAYEDLLASLEKASSGADVLTNGASGVK
jgi:hypothetical protein